MWDHLNPTIGMVCVFFGMFIVTVFLSICLGNTQLNVYRSCNGGWVDFTSFLSNANIHNHQTRSASKNFFIQVNCNNKELRHIAPKVWSKVTNDLKEEN